MAGTTPTYLLPYPESTDTPDGPLAFLALADRIETLLAERDERPLGLLGQFQTTSQADSSSTTAAVAGGSMPITFDAARAYAFQVTPIVIGSAAGALAQVRVRLSTFGVVVNSRHYINVAGGPGRITIGSYRVQNLNDVLSGAQTVTVEILRESGSGTVSLETGSYVSVLDLGARP